jgi:hypothetical protein
MPPIRQLGRFWFHPNPDMFTRMLVLAKGRFSAPSPGEALQSNLNDGNGEMDQN